MLETRPFETMVIGSHPVPEWYPALQDDVAAGRLPAEAFADAKRAAATSALSDQEVAGIDVVSDGELFRRSDNRNGPPTSRLSARRSSPSSPGRRRSSRSARSS